MEIAPGVEASEWLGLHLDDPNGRDWVDAIAIFDKRIRGRYLEPIEVLLGTEERGESSCRRFGFTILAIDCLLIETLQAFRMGLLDTAGRSEEMFREFLTKRPGFRDIFDEGRATEFYRKVRCGILHQAEVRGGWRIWAVGPLLVPLSRGFRVNRTAFHESLVQEFEKYKGELGDPNEAELRQLFRNKMDHICSST